MITKPPQNHDGHSKAVLEYHGTACAYYMHTVIFLLYIPI